MKNDYKNSNMTSLLLFEHPHLERELYRDEEFPTSEYLMEWHLIPIKFYDGKGHLKFFDKMTPKEWGSEFELSWTNTKLFLYVFE